MFATLQILEKSPGRAKFWDVFLKIIPISDYVAKFDGRRHRIAKPLSCGCWLQGRKSRRWKSTAGIAQPQTHFGLIKNPENAPIGYISRLLLAKTNRNAPGASGICAQW